jgi:hypothetical protein
VVDNRGLVQEYVPFDFKFDNARYLNCVVPDAVLDSFGNSPKREKL